MEGLFCRDSSLQLVALTMLEEIQAIITLFEAIAQEEGWQPAGQLRAYLQSAVYFALSDHGTLVGGLQLVRPSVTQKLPIHTVWPELMPIARPDCAHVVILALRKEYRGKGDLFWLLGVELWRYCWLQHITQLTMEVTPATLRLYRRLGWPLEVAGPLRSHWGEDCYPCTLALDALAGAMLERATTSPRYRKLAIHACRGLSK